MNRFLLVPMLMLTLLSCSVKEDRSLCACWLTLDLSSCAGAADDGMVTSMFLGNSSLWLGQSP